MCNCGNSNCPIEKRERKVEKYKDPNCICNKPLWIYIPAGSHIHCPVHPEQTISSPSVTW